MFYIKQIKINLYKLSCIIGIVTIYFITSLCIFNYLDKIANAKVNRNPTAFYLYMGLSLNNPNAGMYSDYVVQKYSNYYELYKQDFERVDKRLITDLRNEYRDINLSKISNLFMNKYRVTWRNDLSALYWVHDSINNPNKLLMNKSILLKYGTIISQSYYILIIFLYIIGNLYGLINFKNNPYLFFINLFVFGVLFLLLISETQGRYKIITYPFISTLATYGLFFINDRIRLRR